MTNTNTAKRTTYKIVGNFNICNQKRICLISLCFGKENAKQKLDEILKKNPNLFWVILLENPTSLQKKRMALNGTTATQTKQK